ncbi:hypothetical protein CWI37_0548p0010 [Hamiltosporidium tvaerminnensis]|uniref:Uncharacterized protein n=1 Tax=Hamiltosporidium tvaerminnensis TaxID=1176355 RepID=A0A4Q9L3N8_9MICR|nr:hypothetical protein CWI37_0548p0010 [Hamiltosporidium tvaerminnensis]
MEFLIKEVPFLFNLNKIFPITFGKDEIRYLPYALLNMLCLMTGIYREYLELVNKFGVFMKIRLSHLEFIATTEHNLEFLRVKC